MEMNPIGGTTSGENVWPITKYAGSSNGKLVTVVGGGFAGGIIAKIGWDFGKKCLREYRAEKAAANEKALSEAHAAAMEQARAEAFRQAQQTA